MNPNDTSDRFSELEVECYQAIAEYCATKKNIADYALDQINGLYREKMKDQFNPFPPKQSIIRTECMNCYRATIALEYLSLDLILMAVHPDFRSKVEEFLEIARSQFGILRVALLHKGRIKHLFEYSLNSQSWEHWQNP